MKKYIIFVWFIFCCSNALAQGYSISVYILGHLEPHTINVIKEGGEFCIPFSELLPGYTAQSIYDQISSEFAEDDNPGLTINRVEWNPNTYSGAAYFSLNKNPRETDRIYNFVGQSSSITVAQSGKTQVFSIVDEGINEFAPGATAIIELSGSVKGYEYWLYHWGTRLQSVIGTGDMISFSQEVNTANQGDYTIMAYDGTLMDGIFTVEFAPIYMELLFYFDDELPVLSANGGSIKIICSGVSEFAELQGLTIQNRLINDINNQNIKFSFNHAYLIKSFDIEYGPNIDAIEKVHDTQLRSLVAERSTTLALTQAGGGVLQNYNTSLKAGGNETSIIEIAGSQHMVDYVLYRDGVRVNSFIGQGAPFHFSYISETGIYTVYAEYDGTSRQIGTSIYIGHNGTDQLSSGNWIEEKVFTINDGVSGIINKTYYNGLGMPSQFVQVTPETYDVVTPLYYDGLYRQSRSYKPYYSPNRDGSFIASSFAASNYIYLALKDRPYAYHDIIYRSSPGTEVECEYQPGEIFRSTSHSVKHKYLSADRDIFHLTIDTNERLLIKEDYTKESLYCHEVTDEDGVARRVYVDIWGRKILERQLPANYEPTNDTYYVYDDLDRLCCVISPEGSSQLARSGVTSFTFNDNIAKQYCYLYKYDSRNRCVAKKLPDAEWIEMVYDKADRLVMSQDGVQRGRNEWTYMVYDNLNRPARQNLIKTSSSLTQEQIQAKFNSSGYVAAYPTTADSWRLSIPFNEPGFQHVATLFESRFGGYGYLNASGYVLHDYIPVELAYEPVFSSEGGSGNVLITEIMYDSPLNEQIATGAAYSNGEYIELFNASPSAVDLAGWKLTGGGSTEIYPFPAGTVMPSKSYLIVAYQYNNSGFTLDQLYSGIDTLKPVLYQRKIILSNSGETVSVIDPSGNVVDAIFYDGTSNKTKPNRLSATNADGITGIACVSLHRKQASYDAEGFAVTDNSNWETAAVSPFLVPDMVALSSPGETLLDERTNGLKIYEKVAILDGEEVTDDFVERAYYYDHKGRVIQTVEKNHMGGISRYSMEYDFVDNILTVHESHAVGAVSDIKLSEFTYDHRGRLLSETTSINAKEKKIVVTDPGLFLLYSSGSHMVSSDFGPYLADKMINVYGVADWTNYEYILDDGTINAAYLICQDGNECYYYFPKLEISFSFETEMWDIISDFKNENTYTKFCFYSVEDNPINVRGTEITLGGDEDGVSISYAYDEMSRLVSKTYGGTSHYIPVSNTLWLSYNPSQNTLSDQLGGFMAYAMLDTFGVLDWQRYNYILEDGSINPSYFICTTGGTDYYYFPETGCNANFEDIMDCVMLAFKQEEGMSRYCFGVTENLPFLGELVENIELRDGSFYALHETYDYNIQGWLTDKKSDVFDMKLRYYNPQMPDTKASYTGNITEWEWQHKGAGADSIQNTYAFTYDKLSRLLDTERYEGDTLTNSFTERDISYDRNGNMLAMKRYQSDPSAPEDNMTFTAYDGNQLTTLVNNGDSYSYEYDANGNMTSDGLNALKLEHNFLNLTSAVSDMFDNLLAEYRWLADGTKAGVRDASGAGLEYVGSLIYKRRGDSLALESAAFGGGRIVVSESSNGNIYTPNYFLTDHLGSTRAVVANGEVIERNDFYPFGVKHLNPTAAITDNRYRFSGKEEQHVFGLPYNDHGARMYDPVTGRWVVVDPLAKKYYPISPYAYVGNNPIRRIDPDGRDWVDSKGNTMWVNGNFTQHATPDFIRGANAMRTTEIGRSVFDDVALNSAKITFIISSDIKIKQDDNGTKTLIKGIFIPGPAQPVDSDGNATLRDGDIIIYEGSIQAEIDGTINIGGETHDHIKALPANQALEGSLGATSVHEGMHTTPKNVQQAYENTIERKKGNSPPHNIEKEPKEKQNQHFRELRERYNP